MEGEVGGEGLSSCAEEEGGGKGGSMGLALSLSKKLSELSDAQSEDRPPSQATVTVFKKHLVSKVPH